MPKKDKTPQTELGLLIQKEFQRLFKAVNQVPLSFQKLRQIEGTGGKISIPDLLAYQIGWARLLIKWYQTGLKNQMPQMPGQGFTSWEYVKIARHFYGKYHYYSVKKQIQVLSKLVEIILNIIEKEDRKGNLNRLGVWQWCQLPSGKKWPLSKWIQVNTVGPYRRATVQVRKLLKTIQVNNEKP